MSLYTEEKEGEKWITISHQHVKIDGDGNIIAGLGGKFNGKSVQHAIDHLTSQNKPSKPKAASKEKVDKPKSKMQHAHDIIKNAAPNALAKDIKKHLADKLGLSPAAASTYYHNIKKKLAPKEDDKEPDKKVEKEKPTEKEDPIPAGEKSSFSNNAEIAKKFIKDLKDLHGANYDKSKAIAGISDKLAVSKAYATGLHDSLVTSMDKAANAEKKTYKDVVDKVEGSGSKAKQAEQIFKQMSGAAPKDVKAAFVNKIGMSQATASTYYFNLKKKFGSSSEVDQLVKAGVTKQDAEKIVQDAKKAGAKFKEDSKKSTLDHAMDLISSMKKDPNTSGTDIIIAVSKKFNISHDESIKLSIKANNVLLDKEAEEFKKKNADPQNHKMDQNDQELAALDIVKKMHKTHSPVDIHAEIAETLGIDYDKAYSLMKKAEKVVNKNQLDDISAKPTTYEDIENKVINILKQYPDKWDATYQIQHQLKVSSSLADGYYNTAKKTMDSKPITYEDMKDKINSSTGGAKIHYNHGEDASIPVPEHVEKFRSRVQLAKKIDPHVDSLDPHDHLVKMYSEDFQNAPKAKKDLTKAVYSYTGSDYHEINGSLRKNTDLGWHKDTVKALDKVFKHPSTKIKKETIVYRGYTSKIVNKLEPGDIFEDKGYMSTTSEEYKAESWAHSSGAVMHILLPEGANAISARPYSQFSSEHEVLINRGAKIRIIEKVVQKAEHYGEDDQITFYAEYVVDKKKK